MSDGHIRELMREFQEGRLPRRQFIAKLLAAGLTMPAVAGVIAACGGGGTTSTPSTSGGGAGAPATQAPAAGASPAAGAAQASGFTPTKRGGGGTLKLLWWQAVSVLNNHLSTGTKDQDGSRLFLEPLASIDQDGNIVPILAAEAPSVAKNTLDKDGKFVIWKLKPNVTWHDGQKFTADDVVFTFQYASDPDTAATSSGAYTNVASVEKVDDLTVKVNFKSPTLEWTAPFVSNNGLILPKHVHEKFKGKESRNAPANLKPVGTGPYKIVEFRPNDIVIAEINDKYHVENRPFFDRVEMKGGGDAVSAARATLQTGEYDYAWNLQVPGDQLDRLEKDGVGQLVVFAGGFIEYIVLNFADPNAEVDGERASLKTPHPFFSDKRVRQAFALAINRKTIVDQLYGKTGEVATYMYYVPKKYLPDGQWKQDMAKANQLLDEAGWRKGGDGVRAKDGKRMKVLYQTSVNKLRQDTQAIVKKDLETLGVEVELKSVDAGVFFASDPANNDNIGHFYADMQMYTSTRNGPEDLPTFLKILLSTEVSQKDNKWSKDNNSRYQSPEFDKLLNQAKAEVDPAKLVDLGKKINQLIADEVPLIPLVARLRVAGASKKLRDINPTGWDSDLWRIAYWNRA